MTQAPRLECFDDLPQRVGPLPAQPAGLRRHRRRQSLGLPAAVTPASAATGTDKVLRAWADPQRRRILRLVRGGELAAGQIAAHFDVTQQAVSHHLQVLHRAGLLHERREGTRRQYALHPEALAPVRAVLVGWIR